MDALEFFWLRPDDKYVGRSWFPPQNSYNIISNLYTDASKYAWGAHLTSQ